MWIIAGLGNPGAKYELTRHNIGFLIIDALAREFSANFNKNFNGLSTKISIENNDCLLLKPQTFMNKSGSSVLGASTFFKVKPQNIIVIHDELDLELGEVRIKLGGGNNGHNGLKDISLKLNNDFIRIRIGIGRPLIKGQEADFVLHNFTDADLEIIEKIIPLSITAIKTIITQDLEKALQSCQIKKI